MKSLHTFFLQAATIVLVIALSSCQKKPHSEFALNQYEYAAGDAVDYDNFSMNDEISEWKIVNSQSEIVDTFSGKYANIVIGILNPDGVYTLRLNSFKKNMKKLSVTEKDFLVKCDRSYLNVNVSSSGNYDDYDVYVDNQYVGSPAYSNGIFQVKIPIGHRLVKLVAGETIEEHSLYFDGTSINLYF
jgi:hypothetical protein